MAPLLPSESAAYSLALPDDAPDDRLNLKLRTGAAATYTRSTVVVHGGATVGLALENVNLTLIEKQLHATLGPGKDWANYVSNELFYLNIVNRKWSRVDIGPDGIKPPPRLYHSLTFTNNCLYLFGGLVLQEGKNKLIPANDLWRFSIDNNVWECLEDIHMSSTISRYDHTLLPVDYISPFDQESHAGLAITGGRGELNQELMNISIFDIRETKFLNSTETQITLNELKPYPSSEGQGRKGSAKGARSKLKVQTSNSFVISGTSSFDYDTTTTKDDNLYVFSQEGITDDNLKNPILSLPVTPNASGIRLPLSVSSEKIKHVVPRTLKNPSGGIFGTNIIVAGQNTLINEYQVYLYNRPSRKWTRLSLDNKFKASEMYLWKSFSWHSHHKVLVLGSAKIPEGGEFHSIQKFDLLVLVGLPITNIFHAFSASDVTVENKNDGKTSGGIKETLSFEAYSKYIAPTSKISSIRSVFPNYAVTLGRNAFERYGSSLADFEFITADGDKVNSMMMLSKASQQQTEKPQNEAPHFRLPFQEKNTPSPLLNSQGLLTANSLPNSRKASVVSASGTSVTSTSTNDLPDSPDFSSLAPPTPPPSEPLPPVDTKPSILKSVGSRDYLRDSPRGSISGASTHSTPHLPSMSAASQSTTPGIKLKDLRSPASQLKKRGTSKSSSVLQGNAMSAPLDESSMHDGTSNVGSVHTEAFDEGRNLLEPLLIPRSLYLPFATSTVQAIAEFLFVGKLGDRWLLYPTTTDTYLVAKFYELPLLYDLISEAMYAILGKKEDGIMKSYTKLLEDYQKRLSSIHGDDEASMAQFFADHPHVKETFSEIEGYLTTVDDGFLNLSLLRKAGKVSSSSRTSATSSNKNSVDMSARRRSSGKAVRLGKSSLSRQVVPDNEDDESIKKDSSFHLPADDIDNEAEEEGDDDEEVDQTPFEPISRPVHDQPIKFRTDSMSKPQSSSPRKLLHGDDDDIDPITPLNRADVSVGESKSQAFDNAIDDEDPLSGRPTSDSKKSDSDSEPTFAVPEGRFKLAKGDKLVKTKRSDSSSKDEKTTTTSDSDELAVGLGLVTNLKQKKRSKGSASRQHSEHDSNTPGEIDEEDDEDESNDAGRPTLESLASPNSPEPGDHIIQIIYEAAALACDMKLLLRAVNAIETSKMFEEKKDELLTELELYGSKFEEDKMKIKDEIRQKETEEQERLAEKSANEDSRLVNAESESTRSSAQMDADDIQAAISKGRATPAQIAQAAELSQNAMSSSFSPIKSNGGQSIRSFGRSLDTVSPVKPVTSSRAGSRPSTQPTTSQDKLRGDTISSTNMKTRTASTQSSAGSDASSITSRKSGFLRPFSNLTLTSRKSSTSLMPPQPQPQPQSQPPATAKEHLHESRVPVKQGSEKKSKFFGMLPRKTTTKK
ncbi:Negative regulator of sporulation MDS3 [Cyberlindnera fabianii]|uniref:Negative regulator of sporulation MDS3 n=1 Tax=Cyberlindnera fabianii TaxID=36022 RepID=A0A1V2LD41_CYBFA|nr:Negative regulator of sporulation MDS3 [Cyberlindnera fabianii]